MRAFKAVLVSLAYLLLWFMVWGGLYLCYATVMMCKQVINGLSAIATQAVIMSAINENKHIITAIAGIITILLLRWLFHVRKKSMKEEICLYKIPLGNVLPIIFIAICAYAAIATLFLVVLPCPVNWLLRYEAAVSGHYTSTWSIMISLFSAPMSEEVIFRGVIYTRLKRELNVYAATFLSSLLFGVIHGMLFWAAYTFVAGLIYVWVFEKYRSLAASILCHMIFNGIGIFHWLCF